MRYMLLIHSDEQAAAANIYSDPTKAQAYRDEWMSYTGDLAKSASMTAGEALQPSATATTVRVNGGKPIVSDGPYAETKEGLGGFYIIDVANLDDAIAWASKMPHMAAGGAVEVRPIMDM
jgi:hypothetical protein